MSKEIQMFDLLLENNTEEKVLEYYKKFKSEISPRAKYLAQDEEYPYILSFLANNKNYDKLLKEIIQDSPSFDVFNSRGESILIKLIDAKKWDLVEQVLEKEINIPENKRVINYSRDGVFDSPLTALIDANKEDLAILAVKAGANYKFRSSETSFGDIETNVLKKEMYKLHDQINEQKLIDQQNNQGLITKVLKTIKGLRTNTTNNSSNKNNM